MKMHFKFEKLDDNKYKILNKSTNEFLGKIIIPINPKTGKLTNDKYVISYSIKITSIYVNNVILNEFNKFIKNQGENL